MDLRGDYSQENHNHMFDKAGVALDLRGDYSGENADIAKRIAGVALDLRGDYSVTLKLLLEDELE